MKFCLMVYAGALGSCLFSFAACALSRKDLSFLHGRSRCDVCGHPLAWYDMIPVVSWLLLRGHCRYCGAKIPVRLLYAEVLGAAVGMSLFVLAECV